MSPLPHHIANLIYVSQMVDHTLITRPKLIIVGKGITLFF